jgi:hypothetical protein
MAIDRAQWRNSAMARGDRGHCAGCDRDTVGALVLVHGVKGVVKLLV